MEILNAKAMNDPIETQDLVLSIASIKPSRFQMRRELDATELNQLAQSLESIGQLHRIGVCPIPEGYELIFGNRRLQAAKLLGWKEIKTTVFMVDQQAVILSIQAAENLQIQRIKTIEAVQIISKLKDLGLSNIAISHVLSKSPNWVTDHEFVIKNSMARSIAEAGILIDASDLRHFMEFPPSIRNILLEIA